jgi:hypothetical protein
MVDVHFSLASLAFPLWLRIGHYINLLFLGLLIRSGIQVLAAHPRLYWNDGCQPESAWLRFTRKQILAPLMILTGAAMSPAIEARFPWYLKLFGGRQAARSLHFLVMVALVLFTLVHTVLVLIVHFNDNLRHIVFGTVDSSVLLAIAIAVIALLFALA